MTTDELRERVYCLAERCSWLGLSADIAALSVVELWGLLAFLERVAGALDGRTSKRWKEGKEKRDGGLFMTIPLAVLQSQAFIQASPYARMLLIDLFLQYRGDNNGDLAACWKFMQPRGWRSETTLQKAKRELLDLELIVETRKGARPNKASLYAVTWCALDHCGGKLEMSAKAFPRGAYRLRDPVPKLAVKNGGLTPPAEVRPSG